MEWTKVEDKLPKDKQIILVIDNISKVISMARFREFDEPEKFETEDMFEVMNIFELEIDYSVTHWMPLPNAPEDD